MTALHLDPRTPAVESVCLVLGPLAQSIADHLASASTGDPEALHELRIGVRRSRSVVTHAKGVLPDRVRLRARAELRALAAGTGPVRDLDVHLSHWEAQTAAVRGEDPAALEDIRLLLVDRRDAARGEMAAVLRRDTTLEWLAGWSAWLASPGGARRAGRRTTGRFVADRLQRAQRRVLRRGRAIEDASPSDDLHRLRKDAKALRYLLDAYRPLLVPGPAKRFTGQLRSLQDELGLHQDAAVQITLYTWIASELRTARANDDAMLHAAAALRADAARRMELHRAAFAPRFAGYDSKANRKAFDELLRPLRRS